MRPVPGLTIELQPEPILLALTLWGEARGEGPMGMLAVAHVILNRGQDSDMRSVILKPLQFSCLNHDDPNREKLLDAWHIEPESWGMCAAVATLAYNSKTTDPTDGAVNYLTTSLYNSAHAPNWAQTMKVTAVVGRQTFGRA